MAIMIRTVQCSSCSTSFPVDPRKVPDEGVYARCSVCDAVFFVEAGPIAEPTAAGAAAVTAAPAITSTESDSTQPSFAEAESAKPSFTEPEPLAEPEAPPAFAKPSFADAEPTFAKPSFADTEPTFSRPSFAEPEPPPEKAAEAAT